MRLVNKKLVESTEETNVRGIQFGETVFGVSVTKPRDIKWKIACPDSTMIRRVKYDDVTHAMRVEFQNGSAYQYEDVPFNVFKDFVQAESVGKFFHQYVRTAFTCEKL